MSEPRVGVEAGAERDNQAPTLIDRVGSDNFNRLKLRRTDSPYQGDINVNSVLSAKDVDRNFIHLKGRDIVDVSYDNNILKLTKQDGEEYDVTIDGGSVNVEEITIPFFIPDLSQYSDFEQPLLNDITFKFKSINETTSLWGFDTISISGLMDISIFINTPTEVFAPIQYIYSRTENGDDLEIITKLILLTYGIVTITYVYNVDMTDYTTAQHNFYFSEEIGAPELWDEFGGQVDSQGNFTESSYGKPGYLNYFDFSSGSATMIYSAGNWTKLNTVTTEGFSYNGLSHTNNRITRTGDDPKIYQIEAITSLSVPGNNEIHLAFFKNDNLLPCSEQVFNMTAKINAVPIQCLVELDQGDYVEVWIKNQNSSNNPTLDNINVIIKEM